MNNDTRIIVATAITPGADDIDISRTDGSNYSRAVDVYTRIVAGGTTAAALAGYR